MRSVIAFLAVTAAFVAINLVAAGVMLAIGKGVPAVFPDARESIGFWFATGAIGVAASVWFAKWLIARPSARVRDRAPG